jgi:hypothetical protein
MDSLVAAALAVNQDNLALGNEVFDAAGARFIRNGAFPSIWDANHVDHVTAASAAEIGTLLGRAEREFEGYPHLRFDLDARTPPEFEARLQLEGGYGRSAHIRGPAHRGRRRLEGLCGIARARLGR